MRQADLTVGSRLDSSFISTLCFYLPAGYSAGILQYEQRWRATHPQHPTGFDLMVSDWLKSRRERYWIHVPSLVEHRECKSVIDPRRSSKRQSKTFRDAV